MPTIEGAESWAQGPEELAHRIALHFGRAEPRRRALTYLRGLLAPLERKNGWQLAEAAGDATPDGVQDFLSRMRWIRGELQKRASDRNTGQLCLQAP